MHPIRVFLVDDHNLFRRGLHAVLEAEPQFQCVGEADSGLQAVRTAPEAQPDIVLMDMCMPGMCGVAAMAALRPLLPRARFVLITCTLDAAELRRAYAAGANCVLHKSTSPQELVTVLHAAYRGQAVYSPTVADAMAARRDGGELGADLTQRERKLLSLMACGLPNREISARLDIAMPTVKFHVTNILSKLHADNRTSAVLAALKHNLVALD
jgi:two-component system, NarL family, response regulator LiaR